MVVKENQPQLWQAIHEVFAEPTLHQETFQTARSLDQGRGRIERRQLASSTALVGYLHWPDAAQVFALTRTRITKSTGEVSTETVYGVTTLTRQRTDAATLLGLTRRHWYMENRSHHVRDVTFAEDHSQVRVGSIPQIMAAVRNTAIGLLRTTGETNVAAASRRYAAQPMHALAPLGITRDC